MFKIDLNCDLGESFGSYKIGMDEEVIPYITSANVACGFHASDPIIMAKTVDICKQHGVAIGAHPGLFDLMGFGRRNIAISPQEAKEYVKYQIGALYAFCKSAGIPLTHVKPHGALYNMAAKEKALAEGICRGVYEFDRELILLGLSGSCLLDAAHEIGLKAASEVFADRNYEEDGSLVSRVKENAIIKDEKVAIDRILRMIKENKVQAISGKDISIVPDSICVHGDNSQALVFVKKIVETLREENIEVTTLSNIVK